MRDHRQRAQVEKEIHVLVDWAPVLDVQVVEDLQTTAHGRGMSENKYGFVTSK
jgi:hypothetical protein